MHRPNKKTRFYFIMVITTATIYIYFYNIDRKNHRFTLWLVTYGSRGYKTEKKKKAQAATVPSEENPGLLVSPPSLSSPPFFKPGVVRVSVCVLRLLKGSLLFSALM